MKRRDFFRTLAAAGLAAVARIYPGAEMVGVVAEPDPLAPAHGYVEWGVAEGRIYLAQWDAEAGAWHSRVIETEDWRRGILDRAPVDTGDFREEWAPP